MGIFFKPYQTQSCCLCGSSESLTGEHKIKASALRKIFGKAHMVIGSFGKKAILRPAQGPKSCAFHFSSRMCSLCNGTRTQAADKEFDKFHTLVSSYFLKGFEPSLIFNLPQYALNSDSYLNVFRYFAKILCCHIAESCGPRPLAVCDFAIGVHNNNFIYLNIDIDPAYQTYLEISRSTTFAAHGGLVVRFNNPKSEILSSLESSITLGMIRYTFGIQLYETADAELHQLHYEFWSKCKIAYKEALKNR